MKVFLLNTIHINILFLQHIYIFMYIHIIIFYFDQNLLFKTIESTELLYIYMYIRTNLQ